MAYQVRGSRADYKSKWTSLHSKSKTGLRENCDSKTDRCEKLFNNRTVNSEGPSQYKKLFSNLYVTRGSYPEYIQKFQDPQTTFTPIICLFNKQGIWHFSNTNTQMSRSTWKTLNILIINQACHETQARQLNTTEATTEPLKLQQDSISNKQNCTEPSPHYHQDSCYQNVNNTYHHTQTHVSKDTEKKPQWEVRDNVTCCSGYSKQYGGFQNTETTFTM